MVATTRKQEEFARLFVETGMATDSYRRVYNTKKTGRNLVRAAKTTKDSPTVAARIKELQSELITKHNITADWVILNLKTVTERSMSAVPVLDSKGDPIGVWTFDGHVATKALELLGKHLGIFTERHVVDVTVHTDQVISKLRLLEGRVIEGTCVLEGDQGNYTEHTD